MGVRQGEGRIPLDLTHHQHKLVIPGHVLRRIYNEQTHRISVANPMGLAVLFSDLPPSGLPGRFHHSFPEWPEPARHGASAPCLGAIQVYSGAQSPFTFLAGAAVPAAGERCRRDGAAVAGPWSFRGGILMEMIRIFGLIAGFGFRSCVVPRSPHVCSRSSFGSTVLQPWQSAPMGNDSRAEGDPGVKPGGLY